ncbi:MAG TPA: ribonuclease HII [Trueperaceae bacterium]|nr:ribonuclease HII [Trueperaceae bacterium]
MPTPARPDWNLEQRLWSRGLAAVAGVDEAGRGALAGPVVAAVVLLPAGRDYPYRDSKSLAPAVRARLAARVKSEAIAFACGYSTAALVDEVNVLEATKQAARAAVAEIAKLIDGLVTDYLVLGTGLPEVAVAKADAHSYQVAAASILAKHTRDTVLTRYEDEYPGYGFGRHFGYGVPQHLDALRRLGPCAEHRRTFAPVTRLGSFTNGETDA